MIGAGCRELASDALLALRWNADHRKVEGEGLGWFNAEELRHLLVRPEDRTAIEAFFAAHGA
jgi:hypothetical protein